MYYQTQIVINKTNQKSNIQFLQIFSIHFIRIKFTFFFFKQFNFANPVILINVIY